MSGPAVNLEEPSLFVTHLSGGYGSGDVLADVGLQLLPGETLLVLGHNGAGKTTLLRLLMGLCERSEGRISLAGNDISTATAAARATRGLCYVMQEGGTFRGLTVAENLDVVARLAERDGAGRRQDIVGRVYDWFPRLADRREIVAAGLSGGETKMLSLSLALLRKPVVLLLDEPTLGLAPATAEDMVRTVRNIQAELNVAVLVTESSLTAVRTLTDTARVVRRGSLTEEISLEKRARDLDRYL